MDKMLKFYPFVFFNTVTSVTKTVTFFVTMPVTFSSISVTSPHLHHFLRKHFTHPQKEIETYQISLYSALHRFTPTFPHHILILRKESLYASHFSSFVSDSPSFFSTRFITLSSFSLSICKFRVTVSLFFLSFGSYPLIAQCDALLAIVPCRAIQLKEAGGYRPCLF